MTQPQPSITSTTHTLPFNRLSPRDFERLCLWLVERKEYERTEHLGAAGSEQGHDIIAWRECRLWAFQCKVISPGLPQVALRPAQKKLCPRPHAYLRRHHPVPAFRRGAQGDSAIDGGS